MQYEQRNRGTRDSGGQTLTLFIPSEDVGKLIGKFIGCAHNTAVTEVTILTHVYVYCLKMARFVGQCFHLCYAHFVHVNVKIHMHL